MHHPVLFHIAGVGVSSHLVLEVLAYCVGFQLFLFQRRRLGDGIEENSRAILVVAAVCGAALGSKILHHLNHLQLLAENWRDPIFLGGGKTMVGALLGGLLAVELIKKRLGVRKSSGDLYALPLCVATIIGRVGCHLSGVADDTHGRETDLPWGMDLGDGVMRHPAALYEILFLGLLALSLVRKTRAEIRSGRFGRGDVFKLYLSAYLFWRIAVDFLKPQETFFALSIIQWCCMLGLAWSLPPLLKRQTKDPCEASS